MNNILITGASKGLGESLARAFAFEKSNLVLHGRNPVRLGRICHEIRDVGVECRIVIGDINSPETIDALYSSVVAMKVNILVNNAGVYFKGNVNKDSTYADVRRMIETNLVAPIILTKRVLPILIDNVPSMVININSIAGKVSSPDEALYCASKHGLRGFMGSFKYEALKYRIQVVDVYLGAMNTDMAEGRPNFDKMIRKEEAAEAIVNLVKNYNSLRVSEIDILRSIY